MSRLRGLVRPRPVVAAALTLLASGAVAVAPHAGAATVPGPSVTLAHAVVRGEGFDICEAPPTSTMRAWLKSPYRTVNIYFAGSQRYCQPSKGNQRYLSAEWVRTVTANGWSLIPTDVGLQAPCYGGSKAKISRTPSVAQRQGRAAADDAVDSTPTGLRALHIPRHSPAYIDIENFPAGHPTCDTAVRRFLLGWIGELRARGYRAGVYGLPTGAIRVLVQAHRANSSYPVPDAIWFARYDGHDSTYSADIPNSYLANHRIHQYLGGVNRTHAGITLNIDPDALNGDVVGPTSVTTPAGPPYAYAISGDPGSGVHIRTAPNTHAMSLPTKTDGDPISIECQTVGETVNGDYVWDRIINSDLATKATFPSVYVHDLFTNTTGGNGVSSRIRHCERTAPTVSVTPLPLTTLRSSATVSYSAKDASGISAYDVRWRKATDRSGFGSWQHPSAWQHTRAKTQTLSGLSPGGTYCLSVRAYDRLTNRSRWSPATCIARPLDDRAVSAGSRWQRKHARGFYLATYTSTNTFRAAASRGSETMMRLGIVATRCASCGKVRILVGGQSVGVIDLSGSSTQRRRTILLPAFGGLRKGTVTVRVITSGKTVQLDGLVISRR
jgi:hypothetical protein